MREHSSSRCCQQGLDGSNATQLSGDKDCKLPLELRASVEFFAEASELFFEWKELKNGNSFIVPFCVPNFFPNREKWFFSVQFV